jgi:hypothetical protein
MMAVVAEKASISTAPFLVSIYGAIDPFACLPYLLYMSSAEIIAELTRLSPAELAQVQAKLKELVDATPGIVQNQPITSHPALGMWKDRVDLPADSVEASRLLRERMLRRTDAAT